VGGEAVAGMAGRRRALARGRCVRVDRERQPACSRQLVNEIGRCRSVNCKDKWDLTVGLLAESIDQKGKTLVSGIVALPCGHSRPP